MDKKDLISIGIDIGGTKISAAAVMNSKIISEVNAYATPGNVSDILDTVFDAIETLKQQYQAKFIGIATAGAVNKENSKVIGSTGNLPEGYAGLKFKKIIDEKFGIKAFIENDANAAAYAEYNIGNAQGHKNTVIITLGTGVGAGIIIEGKLLRGKEGAAAECGHMPIGWEKKSLCTCGAWDCWEAYASGTGYAKTAREMAAEIPESERTGILQNRNPENLTTYDIIEDLNKKDPFAQKVHDRWEYQVLQGLIGLTNIFDPDSIVLSGGMAGFVNFEKVQKQLDKAIVVPKAKLLPAKFENYAGILGAAILATEKFA